VDRKSKRGRKRNEILFKGGKSGTWDGFEQVVAREKVLDARHDLDLVGEEFELVVRDVKVDDVFSVLQESGDDLLVAATAEIEVSVLSGAELEESNMERVRKGNGKQQTENGRNQGGMKGMREEDAQTS